MGSRLLTRVRRSLKHGLGNRSAAAGQQMELNQFWDKILLGTKDSFWREYIDESELRKLMRDNPSSEALWNLATNQLVADVYS